MAKPGKQLVDGLDDKPGTIAIFEDRELLRHAEKVLQVYEGLNVDPSDCVLVHSDVGLHNVAVDDATDAVNGIFDYDSAAWADRHHDFRYLVFDFGEDNLLEAALSVYEPIVRTHHRRYASEALQRRLCL